ncbi:MAG: hypothetical protein PHU95_05425 [Candidatus Thermoplasmatota archaeon]|nr:hypothetical protein [Candidatus Thermoplasmatota archaeon]
MTADDDDWEEKGIYMGYAILGKNHKRRLVDLETGEVIIEYHI